MEMKTKNVKMFSVDNLENETNEIIEGLEIYSVLICQIAFLL